MSTVPVEPSSPLEFSVTVARNLPRVAILPAAGGGQQEAKKGAHMSIRRWSLCLLFGPTTLAMAQPVPAVIEINEISNATAAPTRTESSLPHEIVCVGTDKAFFAATGDVNGRELWSHSASAERTEWDRLPGPLSSDPRLMTPVGSNLYLAEKVADINAAGVFETRERV